MAKNRLPIASLEGPTQSFEQSLMEALLREQQAPAGNGYTGGRYDISTQSPQSPVVKPGSSYNPGPMPRSQPFSPDSLPVDANIYERMSGQPTPAGPASSGAPYLGGRYDISTQSPQSPAAPPAPAGPASSGAPYLGGRYDISTQSPQSPAAPNEPQTVDDINRAYDAGQVDAKEWMRLRQKQEQPASSGAPYLGGRYDISTQSPQSPAAPPAPAGPASSGAPYLGGRYDISTQSPQSPAAPPAPAGPASSGAPYLGGRYDISTQSPQSPAAPNEPQTVDDINRAYDAGQVDAKEWMRLRQKQEQPASSGAPYLGGRYDISTQSPQSPAAPPAPAGPASSGAPYLGGRYDISTQSPQSPAALLPPTDTAAIRQPPRVTADSDFSMPTEPWGNVAEEQVRRLPQSSGPSRADQLRGEFQDIRQRGMQAADLEAAQKKAELENWMNKGGLSSSGVYSSPKPGAWTADAQAGVDSFVANNPRPSPTTLNRLPGEVPPSMRPSPVAQATGAYVPGGNESFGAIPAVRTGDPFLDDNTNHDQLAKDREIKGKNDAHFTAMNDARLGGIAGDRQAADAKRAANLAAQGMTQEQIDMRMHPERFAAPKDPGIAQAQAVDAAERQGRSNLHAIAQKFMRNGLSPAAAYSAAMNVTPTTNPGNMGAVPSLPGLDPMRVIQTSSPGTGMAAAQQSVGTTRADNDLTLGGQRNDTARYGIDSQERVGMANAANGAAQAQNSFIAQLLENALKQSQQQTNQGVIGAEQGNTRRDQTLEMIKMMQQQGIHNYPAGHPERQRYDSLWQSMITPEMTSTSFQPGSQAGLIQAAAPGGPLSQAMKPPAPQGPVAPPQSQDAMIASNPVLMKQHLDQYPVEDQPRQRVELLIRAGRGNDPIVRDFIISQYQKDDPNLFGWLPDRWVSSYEDAGTASPLQAMMGGPSWTDAAAGYMQQNYGYPTEVTRPHLNQWFNK